jgi:hypothetical protein
MPRLTLILDSSQISSFLACPERWRLSNVELITKSNDIDSPISAGTLMHKYLEIYYTLQGIGESSGEAFKAAATFDPDAKDEVDNHQYPLDKALRDFVKARFLDYHLMYSSGDFETMYRSEQDIKIEGTQLIDSVKRVPLVEQGFSYQLLNTNDYLFVLEGRIDWMCRAKDGTNLWVDHKLQFRQRELYKKSIQFRNYALATGLSLGVINYVRMHKTVEKNTFVRQAINFSALERMKWKEKLIEVYKTIAATMQRPSEDGHLYQNFKACEGDFGYPCQYTPICEEYNSLTQIAIKRQAFVPKKEWKPW